MTTDPFSIDRLRAIPDPRGPELAPRADIPPLPELGPSPTRTERRRHAGGAAAVAAIATVAILWTMGIRPDFTSLDVMTPIALLAGFGAAIGALTLRRSATGLPADVRIVNHALWLVPTAFVALTLLLARSSGLHQSIHGGCIAVSTAISLGAGVVASIALRRSFTSAPVRRGAAVGALVGLAGTVAIHSHCPAQNLDHLLVGHGATIVVFALAGAVFGARSGRP